KHGQGTYTFSDGDIFAGEWKDGKVHGNGTYTYPDGAKLIGKWKDGKKNREGKLILSD
ncbi:MAG TPA: membrane-binding protein, partial [Deltaproteobacteria bacterium]|nr:membrane-binding protein [Deltaproteobacteria bacterium]